MSQRQLAFHGCTAAYISRIEAGQRTPSLQMLQELATRLGVSAEWLASGYEPDDETIEGVREQLRQAKARISYLEKQLGV